MNQTTLGSTIRYLRKKHGLTQAMLAERLNVTDKAVSKWERDLSYPDITLLPKLSAELEVTLEDLLKEYIDNEKPRKLYRIFEMSHDVRTPLHIILGCADMAITYRDDPKRLTRYLKNIRISGEYLLGAIERIADAVSCDEVGINKRRRMPSGGECSACDLTGRRILVAEDMAVNREIALELLKQTGAKTEFAVNGADCVEKVKNAPAGHYDMILMDIKMPVMDGIEATRLIRALPDADRAGVPIVAMTANVTARDRNAAFSSGMNGFVAKPVDTGDLFSEIKRLL
ncbi:MAG: response regulator [Clostridia bacterium]|nr:response regulator [Clostridia bacterium]